MKKIIRSSFTVIGLGTFIGLLMGAGWAILGDYKGDWSGIVILGGIVGAIFGLPAVIYLIIESSFSNFRIKLLSSILPVFILSYLVPSRYYGGWLLFLQVMTVIIPAFLTNKVSMTLFSSLAGGFSYLIAWFLIEQLKIVPSYKLRLIHSSDDIFVFYPFIIVLVAIEFGMVKVIIRRFILPQKAANEK